MKKIFAFLALISLLTSSAFAEDFLAKISKGALSDTSPGVKELSLEEMKQVKGGYRPFTSSWYANLHRPYVGSSSILAQAGQNFINSSSKPKFCTLFRNC